MKSEPTHKRKILIISYYWPPSGGSGVQRWLKFVKYLPQFDWEPYVFTPENPSFAVKDESLLKDVPAEANVIHFPIWEPYEAFFKLSGLFGNKKTAKPTDLVSGNKTSFFQKLSTLIRGNFFIPDPRVFWVKPSVSFLHDFLRDNKISTIITTGPPHSMHLIGYRLKKKNPELRWVADFRDPWSEWGFLDTLKVGTIAHGIHRRLEGKVLATADHVITITPFYVRRFEILSGRKVQLLTNGFDEDDFKTLIIRKTEKFIIRHVGIVNEKCNPRPFMLAVEELVKEHSGFGADVRVDFVGEVHPQFREFVQSNPSLSAITSFTASVPHKELIALYGTSSLLLLVLTGYKDAAGYMPGKLFEYIATGLPILGVGPVQGDASALMRKAMQGEMIESDNKTGIVETLRMHYERWKNSDQPVVTSAGIDIYSRRAITQELTRLLDR